MLMFLALFALQYRTLFLGSLINADPTQQVWLHMDEATVNYDAARIASGQVLYRDFFEFQGPVHYYLYAGLFKVFGRSFQAARVLTVATVALSGTLLALLVLRLFESRRAGYLLGASAGVVHAAGFVPTWSCTYPHWTAEALVLGAIVVATQSHPRRYTFPVCGGLVGLAAWTILSMGLPALVAMLGAGVVIGWRRKELSDPTGPALGTLIGFGAVTTLILGGFAIVGGFQDLIYAVFEWPFRSYGSGQVDLNGYASFFSRTVDNHAALGFPWSVCGRVLAELTRDPPVAALLAVVPAIGAGLLVLAGRTGSTHFTYLIISGVSAACVAPPVLQVSRADMTHLAFVGSFGLLGVHAFASRFQAWRPSRTGFGIAFALCATLVLANHVRMHFYHSADRRSWDEYIREDGTSKLLLQHLRPGELLFDTEYFSGMRYFYLNDAAAPMTYVPDASRFSYYTPDQWAEITESLAARRPSVVHTSPEVWSKLVEQSPRIAELYRHHGGWLYLPVTRP